MTVAVTVHGAAIRSQNRLNLNMNQLTDYDNMDAVVLLLLTDSLQQHSSGDRHHESKGFFFFNSPARVT